MATKKDVELAALVKARSEKIQDIRKRHLEMTKQEEERREAWGKQYYTIQGEIRAAESELMLAAEAEARILREIPMEVRRDAEMAASAVRAHQETVARARMEAEAARVLYDRRRVEARKPGADPLMKDAELQLIENVKLKDSVFKAESDEMRARETKAAKLRKIIDDEVVKIKRAAK